MLSALPLVVLIFRWLTLYSGNDWVLRFAELLVQAEQIMEQRRVAQKVTSVLPMERLQGNSRDFIRGG